MTYAPQPAAPTGPAPVGAVLVRPNLDFDDEIRPWPVPGLLADALAAQAQIPPGANNVLMGYFTHEGGETKSGLVYMRKLPDEWTAVIDTAWKPKEPLSARVMVVKAW